MNARPNLDALLHGRATPVVMGVVNVTPDSFSDGGEHFTTAAAIAHGRALASAGAHLLDVGGESTRPGAQRPSQAEELRRVIPVVRALADAGYAVSIDTMRASVAQAALAAGACLVNDVSGGLADGQMPAVVAAARVPYVVMHWRGHSEVMASLAHYDDVVAEVRDELARRVTDLVAAGIARDQLILDPGLGFAKTAEHNWQVLARLRELTMGDLPVLLGASRKRFLGRVGRPPGGERSVQERDAATAATSLVAAQAGVWGIRVHDVVATVDALAVWEAVQQAGSTHQRSVDAAKAGT